MLATISADGEAASPANGVVLGDRIEVGFRFLVQRLADRERVFRKQQRVAVRLRGGDVVPGEIATGAGPILDHHRLAERLLQVVVDLPREGVGGAARHESHDEVDRTVGIRLCAGFLRRECERGNSDCQQQSVRTRESSWRRS